MGGSSRVFEVWLAGPGDMGMEYVELSFMSLSFDDTCMDMIGAGWLLGWDR